MTKEEEISQFLEHIALAAKGTVFGSDFGKELAEKYPNFKEEYGGLKAFLTQYCSDKIKLVGKRGGNDLYSHVTNNAQVNDDVSRSAPPKPSPRYVFATPSVPWKLYLNSSTCELQVMHINDALPLECQEIPSLAIIDHKKIAAEFLTKLNDGDQEPLKHILSLDDFWPNWQFELQNNQKQNFPRWIAFRRESINELFKSKLNKFDISDECKARLALTFQKSAKSKQRDQVAFTPHYPTRKTNNYKTDYKSLRSLTLKIVGEMSYEELSSLKVSMLAVHNALNSASDS